MVKKLEAVIFDYDGTIIDTEKAYYSVTKELLKECIGKEIEKEDYIYNVSGTSADQFKNYIMTKYQISIKEFEDLENKLLVRMKEKVAKLKLLPYIEEVFCLLKENSIKIGIASNGSIEHIIEGLKNQGLYNYVDDIVTKYDVEKGKPYPDIYIHAAERLGVNIENCIAVEDSRPGAMAAASSGAYLILQTNEITSYFNFDDINYKEKDCNLYEVVKSFIK